MSKEEIKSEINKVLDTLPDNALQDLLSFLKSVGKKSDVKNKEVDSDKSECGIKMTFFVIQQEPPSENDPGKRIC